MMRRSGKVFWGTWGEVRWMRGGRGGKEVEKRRRVG